MNVQDIALISIGGIKDRKFRFALNLLGILIGCAAVTGLISVTQGMNTEINGQLDILGANAITVLPSTDDSDTPFQSGPQSMMIPVYLSWRDLQIIEAIPGIDRVAPIQQNFCTYTLTGNTHITTIMGVGIDIFAINPNYEISDGRSFTRSDKAVAIIGSNVAYPEDEEEPILEVGDRLKITSLGTSEPKELSLRIVGITKESGMTMGMTPDDMIMIPIRASEQFFESSGYDMIMASLFDIDDTEIVTSKIKDKIEDIQIVSAESVRDMIGQVTGTIESVLGGIAAISLVVAGVGIINTMTVSVSERTKEIGTLKAIGAKNIDVLMIFLVESGYTGLAGGFLGGAFGFALGILIGNVIDLPIFLDLGLWTMVVLFAILTSIIAGAWPAWSASNLDPVEALRRE
jgi:putative ABC transport system permease protein